MYVNVRPPSHQSIHSGDASVHGDVYGVPAKGVEFLEHGATVRTGGLRHATATNYIGESSPDALIDPYARLRDDASRSCLDQDSIIHAVAMHFSKSWCTSVVNCRCCLASDTSLLAAAVCVRA